MNFFSKVARRLGPKPTETIAGYEHSELVDVIFRKTRGYAPSKDEQLDIDGAATVMDFGGGCGRHYKQAMSQNVRWAVVETPAMVARAAELTTDRLRFFSDVGAAAEWLGAVDLMHSDGALQYTPAPAEMVARLCKLNAKTMLWRRLLISDLAEPEIQTSYLTDNGPAGSVDIKEKLVSYARVGIRESAFLEPHSKYTIAERGRDWFRFHSTRMM